MLTSRDIRDASPSTLHSTFYPNGPQNSPTSPTITWKACPSYPLYMVSNHPQPQVYKLPHSDLTQNGRQHKGRYLTPYKSGPGYLMVSMGRKRQTYLHHLVADAFLGPRLQSLYIDHIDRNRLNSHPSNLRYVTPSQNSQNKDHAHLATRRPGGRKPDPRAKGYVRLSPTRFMAYITHNGQKRTHYCASESEAIAWRTMMLQNLFHTLNPTPTT